MSASKKYVGVWFFGDRQKTIHPVKPDKIVNFDIANIDYKKPYYVLHKGEKKPGQIVVVEDTLKGIKEYNDTQKDGRKRIVFSSMRRSIAVQHLKEEETKLEKEKAKQKRLFKKKLAEKDKLIDEEIVAAKLKERSKQNISVENNSTANVPETIEKIKRLKEKNARFPIKEFIKKRNVLLSDTLSHDDNNGIKPITTTAMVHEQPRKLPIEPKVSFESHPQSPDAIDNIETVVEPFSPKTKKIVDATYIQDLEQQIATFDFFKNDVKRQMDLLAGRIDKLTGENARLTDELQVVQTLNTKLAAVATPAAINHYENSTSIIKTEVPLVKVEQVTPHLQKRRPLNSGDVIDLTDSPTSGVPSVPVRENGLPDLNLATPTSAVGSEDNIPSPYSKSPSQKKTFKQENELDSESLIEDKLCVNRSPSLTEYEYSAEDDDKADSVSTQNNINRQITSKGHLPLSQMTPINMEDISFVPSKEGSVNSKFQATPSVSKRRKTLSARRRLIYTPLSKSNETPNMSAPSVQSSERHVNRTKTPKRKMLSEEDEDSSEGTPTIPKIMKMRKVELKHFKKTDPVKHAKTKLVINGLFPTKAKIAKGEDSEHEYDSDNFEKFEEADDFTRFAGIDKVTEQKVNLFHLKHGTFITYKQWQELLDAKTPSIFIRDLSLLLWKKKRHLMDCAVQLKKAVQRIPGRERKKMPVLLKTVLWKAYFYYLRSTFLDHKVTVFEPKWKRYLSSYINQLISNKLKAIEQKKKEMKE